MQFFGVSLSVRVAKSCQDFPIAHCRANGHAECAQALLTVGASPTRCIRERAISIAPADFSEMSRINGVMEVDHVQFSSH